MTDLQTFEIRIHGENLPGSSFGEYSEIRVGIQKGEEVEQEVPGDADHAIFIAALQVKRNANDGRPMFSGPYVFGPTTGRFLYLSWAGRKGGEWERFRRAKLPLQGLEWDRLMRALDTGQPVEITLNLTDAKGGPTCGGLKDRTIRFLQ
ncbi:MAG: hypothetical protein KY468_07565 [Armatimonadetes bacterium]|nr:hypothetical protein [Armatimonadota bacterium]